MDVRYFKMMALVLALFFLSSCAVWVRDDGYHHRFRHHHWRSSLQQSDPSIARMTAQDSRDSGSYEQVTE